MKKSSLAFSSESEMENFYNSSDAYLAMLAAHDESYLPKYIDFIRKFVHKGSSIIDIGCGRGKSTQMLAGSYDVIGVDLSKKFISYAKRTYKGVRFRVCSALKLPFKDNSFDAAVSYSLIEHVTDVPRFLDEAIRITKPGGHVIVVAPNLSSPLRPLRVFFSARGYNGFTSSRIETVGWLLKGFYWSFSKWFAADPKFIYRKPKLNASGPDADATYVSNICDVRKYVASCGLTVLKSTPSTFSWNFLPIIYPHIGVVAVKN